MSLIFEMIGRLTHIVQRGWNNQPKDHSVSTAKIIQPSRPIVSCALFSWPSVRCPLGGYTHTVIHGCWETIQQHSAIMFAHCRLETLRGIRISTDIPQRLQRAGAFGTKKANLVKCSSLSFLSRVVKWEGNCKLWNCNLGLTCNHKILNAPRHPQTL